MKRYSWIRQAHHEAAQLTRRIAVRQAANDHRDAAVVHRVLAVAQNSPQVSVQREISGQIHNGPRMTAQRKVLKTVSAGAVQRLRGQEFSVQRKNRRYVAMPLQLKNSSTPNWYQEYQRIPAIHGQGIDPYIQHVERGEGAGGHQQGVHALTGGNAPPNVTIVEQRNVGYNSIGKILWHFTDNPGANGTAHDPIPVKNSTVFPTRLSDQFGGITGVRALMKAAAAGNGLAQISRGAGLPGAVQHVFPSIYPAGTRLRPQNQVFNVGVRYYTVI